MRKKIIKDTVGYSVSTFLSQLMIFGRGIIVARFLGPLNYGFWNALSLILEYSSHSHLGTLNAMNREIPFNRGREDEVRVSQIRNAVFSTVAIASFSIALVLFVYSFFAAGRYSPLTIMGIRFIALLVILQQLHTYFRFLFSSVNEFGIISKSQLIFALFSLLCSIVLVTRLSLFGYLLTLVLSYMLVLLFMYRFRKYPFRIVLDIRTTISLIKIGMPIALTGFAFSLLVSVDRLFIIKFLGKEALGYYGITLMLFNFITLLPGSVSMIMYPRLSEQYGLSNKDLESLRGYIITPTFILSYIMPIVLGMVYFVVSPGVHLLLPQYIPGITAAKIALIGMFFFSIIGVMANFLFAIDKWYQSLVIILLSLVLNITLDYTVIRMGGGINQIAISGIVVTYVFYATCIIIATLRFYIKDTGKLLGQLLRFYFPVIYILPAVFITDRVYLSNLAGGSKLVCEALLKLVVFLLISLPLIWRAFKKLHLGKI